METTNPIKTTQSLTLEQSQDPIVLGLINIARVSKIKASEALLSYFELCTYIRENVLMPKVVSFALRDLGYSKGSISELNRVANAPEDIWKQYQDRSVGFKLAVEMTRNKALKRSTYKSHEDKIIILSQQIIDIIIKEGRLNLDASPYVVFLPGYECTFRKQKRKDSGKKKQPTTKIKHHAEPVGKLL